MSILDFARQARAASIPLAAATADSRNAALLAIATALRAHRDELTQANQLDLDAAEAAMQPKLGMIQRVLYWLWRRIYFWKHRDQKDPDKEEEAKK